MRILPFLFALAVLLGPVAAWADAGEVRFAQGDVHILRAGGKAESAVRGTRLHEGDTIVTGAGGYAQLTMVDDAIVAVRPDTRLKVETYRYSGKVDGSEKGVWGLVRGGFRTLTGWIGRNNKDAYAVRTPTATIGIRGTDHEPMYIPPPAAGEIPLGEPGTYNKVNSGQTYIQTGGGRLELGANQVGFAAARGDAPPVRLAQMPSFMKVTPPLRPVGSGPRDKERQERQERGDILPQRPPPPPALVAMALAEAPVPLLPPALLPPVQAGTVDPRYIPPGSTPAPLGYVAAGGDLSPGVLDNGALVVGNPLENGAVLLGPAGLPLAVGTSGGFNYSSDGAPVVDAGTTTVGSHTINWGIYAGGTISDNAGVRHPQYFFFMGGGIASTPATLAATLPGAGATLSFSSVGGYTKPITESGAVGGSVGSILVELKNVGGNIMVSKYNLGVTDALGRTWSTSMPAPVPLGAFVIGGTGTPNLSVGCAGCTASTGTGNARGAPFGNPVPLGAITSYSLQAGTSGVVGAVLAK